MTRALTGELIYKPYRVRFTEPGVGKYLKRWGLTFQRPDKRAVEQDPEAVRVWCEETWPAIRAAAKAEGAEVLFGDQIGSRSDQATGGTWGEQGRTPVVRRTGNRFSVNAMSAISTKGRMHFMVFTDTFDAQVMCRFLARLVSHFDRKVHLIVDRHSAHRSKARPGLARRPQGPDRTAFPALVLTRTEPGRAGQRRPQTQPAPHPPDQKPGRTRRRNPPVLPSPTAPATHRPRLIRRPARPLHPRREPHEFLINSHDGERLAPTERGRAQKPRTSYTSTPRRQPVSQ